MFVTPLILFSLVFLIYKYATRHFNHWKNKNVFYIKPVPFFGNVLDIFLFRVHQGPFFADLYRRTKEPFFGIFVFDTPHLVVRSPELVKAVLVKDAKTFDDRCLANPDHDPMTSHMLLLVKNPEWKAMRTKMTPIFTSGKLKAMFPLVSDCGEEMIGYVAKQQTSLAIEAKEICAKYATDVIAKCAFGIDAGSFRNERAEFRAIGRMVFDFRLKNALHQAAHFFTPLLVKIFRLHFVDPEVTDFLRGVFWETIRRREAGGAKGNDVIDALIKMKNNEEFCKDMKFEGDKVVSQAAQFFFAGFETTSATMAFTLYELCIAPRIQERLRKEIQSVTQAHGGLTYEAIQNMPYLHMCVSEVLRKYPVLPFLDRRCKENYKIPESDVVIEKGTPVYVSLFGLHYDPEYWPDPDKYDPERFSEENLRNIVPYSYIPFGEGPRVCVGERFGLMGTKLGLVKLLSEYQVEKTPETPIPIVFETKGFVLASKVGLPMKFTKSQICAA